MKLHLPFLALIALGACSYPRSSATTVDSKPLLSIANAPLNSQLTVDGVLLGDATQYAPDKKQIALDHGMHHVVVSLSQTVLFDNNVYLGDGTDRTIDLPH